MSHAEESTPHVMAGCSTLAQIKYLARHNSLWDAKKTDNIPPWFSPTEPKPVDQNQRAKVYWDELVYAKKTEVRVNTIEVRRINKEDKKVTLLEMTCPWMENREAKDSKMTMRYAPLGCHSVACVSCELKMQKCRSGDDNIILDVLRGASMNTAKCIKTLIRERPGRKTLRKMQKKCFVTLFEHCEII